MTRMPDGTMIPDFQCCVRLPAGFGHFQRSIFGGAREKPNQKISSRNLRTKMPTAASRRPGPSE